MPALSLPFWVVTERESQSPPEHEPCDSPQTLHAFTSTDRMAAFLEAREAGSWKVSLIANWHGLFLVIADAHQRNSAALCVDPMLDGSNGKLVSLTELIAMSEELKRGDSV